MTSTSETGESSGHPIFISTSATHTMTPVPGGTLYSSSSSSGSVLVGSEGSKTSIDGRRKRPASNLTTPRQNIVTFNGLENFPQLCGRRVMLQYEVAALVMKAEREEKKWNARDRENFQPQLDPDLEGQNWPPSVGKRKGEEASEFTAWGLVFPTLRIHSSGGGINDPLVVIRTQKICWRHTSPFVWLMDYGKSRGVCSVGTVSVEEAGSVALSPREQRALRRKEKSRLAAKMRRNQESNILFCLLRALPVSLPETAGSEGTIKATPSGLNLEKSGVIRMAGQTLFLYNSLSQGTKAAPFISLLSKSLYGLLVHPKDSTVVYATPPLAEAINWPWINLIGVKLESLIDEGKLPARAGETVNLRVLEQTNSPTKSSVHNHPSTPLRSPSHSPTSTLSTSTSGGDQTSPLWSPHLYRSSKNGTSGTFTGIHYSAFGGGNKAVPYLICTCFAILRVPITRLEDGRSSATAESTSQPVNHLNLYLLQPTPNLGLPKDTVDPISRLTTSQVSTSESLSSSSSSASASSASPSSSSSFHRNKERYLQNRQRRLLMQNPPPKLPEDGFVCPRDFFCIVLDRSLAVKWVENSDSNKASIFSFMIGQPFLDFIALHDLEAVSKLLTESYWVRTVSSLFGVAAFHFRAHHALESLISPRSLVDLLCSWIIEITSENQQYTGNSISTGSVATTPQVKRPIRVLKLQPQQQPLSQQPVTASTLQPLRVSPSLPTNSGPYLAPLAAAPTRDTQIVYETLVATPWVIYARSISAPQPSLVKTISPLPQNSSFNFLLPGECNEIPLQHSNKIPRLSPPHTIAEPSQAEKWPATASSPALNLPDMLQELDPETLAMLEENEDAKSDSLLTSLSFDDILSSISITPSSGDELNQEKQICTSGSFCSSESSPPSLPESFVSSTSCTRTDQPSQQQQQLLQQREMSLFSDVELDTDMPSDTDEFWDALVTSGLCFGFLIIITTTPVKHVSWQMFASGGIGGRSV
ncbi:Hypoxia-inducible factor 1-alpha [Taenia solium]|eukprot:TsM_000400500 transcript=TsM_000400500 gene=TsM_000400500